MSAMCWSSLEASLDTHLMVRSHSELGQPHLGAVCGSGFSKIALRSEVPLAAEDAKWKWYQTTPLWKLHVPFLHSNTQPLVLDLPTPLLALGLPTQPLCFGPSISTPCCGPPSSIQPLTCSPQTQPPHSFMTPCSFTTQLNPLAPPT